MKNSTRPNQSTPRFWEPRVQNAQAAANAVANHEPALPVEAAPKLDRPRNEKVRVKLVAEKTAPKKKSAKARKKK